MAIRVELKWRGDEAKRAVLKDANNRLAAAGRHLRDSVKRNISVPSRTAKKTAMGKAIGKARRFKPHRQED